MTDLATSFSEQPENIASPQTGASFFERLKTKWPIAVAVILSGTILLTGIIYFVYSYSRSNKQSQPTLTPTPTAISSQGKIAFVRDGDIWVINPDGSGEERITTNTNVWLGYWRSLWSPDGDMLLFMTRDPTKDDPYKMRLDLYSFTTKMFTQIPEVSEFDDGPFQWSSDSKNFFFFLENNLVSYNIGAGIITKYPDIHLFDDQHIYLAERPVSPNTKYALKLNRQNEKANVILKELATQKEKNLGTINASGFTWSPDSKKIAFLGESGGAGYDSETELTKSWIKVFNIDDSDIAEAKNIGVAFDIGADPPLDWIPFIWAPNNAWLAFVGKGGSGLLSVDPNQYPLPKFSEGRLGSFDWSPAGNRVLVPGASNNKFLIFDTSINPPKKLQEVEVENWSDIELPFFGWFPDGKFFVYADGNKNLYMAHVEKGFPQKITTNASQPVWSPQ